HRGGVHERQHEGREIDRGRAVGRRAGAVVEIVGHQRVRRLITDGSMAPVTDTPGPSFERLVEIMRRLRAPDGCPWDRGQTAASLRPFVLEETYEVLEA